MSNQGMQGPAAQGRVAKFLSWVERVGNKLPDPALLFLFVLALTWFFSWWLAGRTFDAVDPATGATVPLLDPRSKQPLTVNNLLEGGSLVAFLTGMVKTFMNFPPLGVVLVALLGVGVAESTGLINSGLKWMLNFTPRKLLTPMVIFVGILSHIAVDAGYVLVIPLGGIIFYAAGRHPLAGIAAAFAGVSGGFSANPLPSSLDPLLQGFTQAAAQIIDPQRTVNPLCNLFFTQGATLLIVLLGWFITDKIVEPRLSKTPIDGDGAAEASMGELTAKDRKGLLAAVFAMLAGIGILAWACYSPSSPLRNAKGDLTMNDSPLMQIIVPLIFLLFLIPGIVYGVVAGTVKSHRDIVKGMSKSMSGMGYYLVMAFFCALFLDAFTKSNLGALLALKGAGFLRGMGLPPMVTVIGIVFLTATVNLAIGSASAKWGLLSPIFVPMLMQLGLSPELTQAAYRVGDSCTNIITPLMPYFPLVVVFCSRYVKGAGIGTLISMMLPYSILFLLVWTTFLLGFWWLGFPLGPGATYNY